MVTRKTFLTISDTENERSTLVTVAGIVDHRVILRSENTIFRFEDFILFTKSSTEKSNKYT